MMPGDIRAWVALDAALWREKYSGKTFMLLAKEPLAFADGAAWDVLFDGRRAVYSEAIIRTHSRPL